MPIVTLPRETALRLHDRIATLDARIFPASDVVMGIGYTQQEVKEFNFESGDAMILAVADIDTLTAAIPEFEGDQRNYCFINHPKAIARLDPFAKDA